MSIATTIIIVVAIVGLYYVGMICYDLYVAKMQKAQSDEPVEESIDVSGQLSDFESHEISNQDEATRRKRSFVSFVCKGLSPEKMNQLMKDAASGTPNAELKNIMYMCDNVAETA